MTNRFLALLVLALVTRSAFGQISPHGPLKMDCQTCHATDSWTMRTDAAFTHASTGFALTGRHQLLACASCHEALKFTAQSSACLSCHTDVHKSELGDNCKRCHSTLNWRVADMMQKHQETRFPLVGRHLTATCQSCHANASTQQYMGTPTTCVECHRSDYQLTKNPEHVTAGFPTDCAKCHRVTAMDWGQSFDHDLTAFPLGGAHKSVSCISCHANGRFKGTPVQCSSCHRNEYTASTNPNHSAAGFSMDCQGCHTPTTWTAARYDHTALTHFPLTGAHQSVRCADCHGNNVFAGRPTDCFSCHQADFTRTSNPAHVAGNFDHNCTQCHTTTAWQPATFNHAQTRFPLTGAHQAEQCQSCHINGNYHLAYADCYQCHQTQFQQTTNPNHVSGNFGHDCSQCHSTTNWSGATFNHATTRFPLTGAHVATQCQQCHTGGNYQLTYNDCFQCHQLQYQQTTNPNHVTGNFAHDCSQCHSTTNWTSATFNHATTRFPLTGAHVATQCQSCHINGNYQLVFADCYQCHQQDFQQTTNPNHVTGNFSHDCAQCHSTINWNGATFNHATTRFPLTGAHVSTQCATCHVNNNYQLVYSNCYQCHQQDFQQANNPNHVTGNFSHDCSQCHSTLNWNGATFNHNTTRFPLTGAHVSAQCAACHVNNNYQLVYNDCYQCHQQEFQQTTNPNHVANNYSHDCSTCHSTTHWDGATFDHATTRFPLTGAHVSTQCASCHVNNNYQLVYTDCYQCHATDFTGATNPNHLTGNFSHDCTQCHSTTLWQPATFNHASTPFPLTGAHLTATCQSCHVNGNYQLHYTDCYQCHATDFAGATNPNHVTGNFSHDCTQCHSTTLWQPATFNHASTPFPLTGAHLTATCQSCHVNGNYQLHYTDCYACHQTQFAQPTNPNHVLGNFGHNCTPCHTTSVWRPSTFSHNNTPFPLTGAHQAVACNSCHVNNQYQNIPTACYDCHMADFNGTTNPNHVTGNFSHDCTQCHNTAGWSPATFNHAQTLFPLTGAHTSVQCQTCHVNGNYQLHYTDCYQCHQSDYAGVANPNHVTQAFSHNCTPCHSTSVWTPNTMSHDSRWFRIYTGEHRGRWSQCTQCHPVPGNLPNFSCMTGNCHPQAQTNSEHNGRPGYVYQASACYSCHRNV